MAKSAPTIAEAAGPLLEGGAKTLAAGIAAGSIANMYDGFKKLIYDPKIQVDPLKP